MIYLYNGYITNIIHFFIMLIDFTEFELETISAAMEDYIQYADADINSKYLYNVL